MTLLRLLAALTLPLVLPTIALSQGSSAPAAASAEPLAGVWKATRHFGRAAIGRLIVMRSGQSYAADLAGHPLAVRNEGRTLSFDLPGDRGAFRGRLEPDGVVRGYWLRPPTPVNGGFALPLVLRGAGPERWIGEVPAMQDEFTLYLLTRPRPDGSLDAVLRNPERDIGTQLGVQRLVRDGEVVRLMGRRGDAPERELASGRYDPEREILTLVIPNRGGSYDFARDDDHSDFYPRGRTPGRYAYRRPPALDDGWPTSSPAAENIDGAAIERLVQRFLQAPMDSAEAPQIHALLIARNGRLVVEEYFHGVGRDDLHETRSAGKSVASVTIGAAMHAGARLSLSSPVYSVMNGGAFPADVDPHKRAMTLEHLLTMSSGYFCDDTNPEAPGNEDTMQDQAEEPDWLRFTLGLPLATPPGENSVYCSISPNLALGMLARATGESPLHTFDRLVATPLRIERYAWFTDPAGNPYGGGGVRLTARDFLKFGQLMLNGGTWNGRRILSADFAAAATSPQYHLRNIFYGYLWWIEDLPYNDRTVRSYSARGAGGNLLTVVPELDLVVATMAGNYSSRSQITQINPLVARSILPAVRERGDDPNAPVQERDFTSPYGRSTNGSRVVLPPGGGRAPSGEQSMPR
jgi:CubicO group peptidase (beta-lactamase class C family)